MTIPKIILWLILTAALYCGLYGVLFPLKKKNKVWINIVITAAEVILAVACAYIAIAADQLLPRYIECALAMLYTVFFAEAATELILMIVRLFKKDAVKNRISFITGAAVTVGFLMYMVINSQVITPDYHTFTSPKLKHNHKIVYVSDLHYGNTQTAEAVKKAFDDIKNENPELLLLGGDITDEYTSKEDMKYIYKQIGSLGIPVYFAYGNHDRQNHSADTGGRTYSDNELEEALKENGINALCDDYKVLDDLVIFGREDYDSVKRVSVDKLKKFPDGKYVINLDHSPYLNDDIKKTEADLQLSGHVHAAQLFPLRLLYTLAVDNICGKYRSGNTDIYVSPGISGWAFPLRSESHCRYEVINLKSE